MSTFYSFDNKEIEEALDAASKTNESIQMKATESDFDVRKAGDLQVFAGCIKVTIEDHKICFDLPLGFGKHCISIPVKFPNGTAAEACLRICTIWKIPTGIEVSIVIGGVTVIRQVFGKC